MLARRAVLDHATQLTVEDENGLSKAIAPSAAQYLLDAALVDARARYAIYQHWQGFTWADWQTRQTLNMPTIRLSTSAIPTASFRP